MNEKKKIEDIINIFYFILKFNGWKHFFYQRNSKFFNNFRYKENCLNDYISYKEKKLILFPKLSQFIFKGKKALKTFKMPYFEKLDKIIFLKIYFKKFFFLRLIALTGIFNKIIYNFLIIRLKT